MSERLGGIPRRAGGRSQTTALLLGLILMALAGSGLAHGLNVFAWVDGNDVVVEGKFSSGKRPVTGHVTVYDGHDKLLLTTDLQRDGTARFPLPDYASGLKVGLSTGGGHDSFWILTPFDIESQRARSAAGGGSDESRD
jgi:nickel transport protein